MVTTEANLGWSLFQSLIGNLQTLDKSGESSGKGPFEFQSLIGNLQTQLTFLTCREESAFQSLIGNLQTWSCPSGKGRWLSGFQSLIGNLQTIIESERGLEN